MTKPLNLHMFITTRYNDPEFESRHGQHVDFSSKTFRPVLESIQPVPQLLQWEYRGADKSLARAGKKQAAPVKSVMGRGIGLIWLEC